MAKYLRNAKLKMQLKCKIQRRVQGRQAGGELGSMQLSLLWGGQRGRGQCTNGKRRGSGALRQPAGHPHARPRHTAACLLLRQGGLCHRACLPTQPSPPGSGQLLCWRGDTRHPAFLEGNLPHRLAARLFLTALPSRHDWCLKIQAEPSAGQALSLAGSDAHQGLNEGAGRDQASGPTTKNVQRN